MVSPDVARSMAAHPSSQRPKIVHYVCRTRDCRICDGKPAVRILTADEAKKMQRCVVCADLTSSPHCGCDPS